MTVRELVTVLGFKLNDAPLKKYNQEIDGSKKKAESMTAAFVKAQAIYGAAMKVAGTAVGIVRDSILGVAAETERYRVVLGTMMGDQEKANKIIHDLDYSPVSDFYGTAKAIGGLQGMVTFGMQAEEASEILTRLGDVAQGNGEAFVSMSNNMGQVFAKGKADATDLKQFVMQGFDVVGEVANQTGKSREEIQKAGVSYEQTAVALKALTSEGGKYFGMLEKQANTYSGLVNQFKSFFAATGEAIGTNILEPLKDIMRWTLRIAKSFQDDIVANGTAAFSAVLTAIFEVMLFFHIFQMRLEELGVSFEPIKKIFEDVFGFLGSALQSAMPFIMNIAAAIIAAFEPIEAFVRPILESLKKLFAGVFGFATDSTDGLAENIKGLTPLFEALGNVIGKLSPWILGTFFGTKGIISAFNIGKTAIGNYHKAINLVTGIQGLFSGNLLKTGMAFRAFGLPQETIDKITSGFEKWKGRLESFGSTVSKIKTSAVEVFTNIAGKVADVTKALLANAAAGLKAAAAWIKQTAQMIAHKVALIAYNIAQKAAAIASKIWAVAQMALNAVMAVNPITWIILAVVALIAIIVLLVKNWDKVGPVIKKAFAAVGNFFKNLWNGIKSIFAKILAFVKKNLVNIVNIVITILFPIAGIVMALVRLIIKHWETIKGAVVAVFNWVVEKAKAIWNGIVDIVSDVVEGIKTVWNGIVEFFAGLWEAIKQGPAAAIEYIRNAFSGLFDGIKDKFMAVFNFLQEGWDKIKNFFSGIGEGIADFFTGGEPEPVTRTVNDLIVTPEGRYSTHPDDFIMAMKNPASLLDALARFAGAGQPQLAYAAAQNTARGASNYSTSNNYNNSSVSAPINVSVNASGMTPDQARSAVQRGVESALREAINGSRGNIPSAEARRR